jgi:hypothetical protein
MGTMQLHCAEILGQNEKKAWMDIDLGGDGPLLLATSRQTTASLLLLLLTASHSSSSSQHSSSRPPLTYTQHVQPAIHVLPLSTAAPTPQTDSPGLSTSRTPADPGGIYQLFAVLPSRPDTCDSPLPQSTPLPAVNNPWPQQRESTQIHIPRRPPRAGRRDMAMPHRKTPGEGEARRVCRDMEI